MAVLATGAAVALRHSEDGGTSYTAVPGILSVDKGTIQTEEIDATDGDSTGNFREFISGYAEAAEGTVTLHNDTRNTKLLALRTASEAGTVELFELDMDGETTTFSALIKGYSEPFTIGEKLVVTMTLKLTGQPTYAVTV